MRLTTKSPSTWRCDATNWNAAGCLRLKRLMKCTQACPTDALTPIANDPESIATQVDMGVARVNEGLCYSYNDRICGVCYYACPFPDTAIRLKTGARPVVDDKACVGCGSCERACIHLPQAIRVTARQA